jgi:hypothetical protein
VDCSLKHACDDNCTCLVCVVVVASLNPVWWVASAANCDGAHARVHVADGLVASVESRPSTAAHPGYVHKLLKRPAGMGRKAAAY